MLEVIDVSAAPKHATGVVARSRIGWRDQGQREPRTAVDGQARLGQIAGCYCRFAGAVARSRVAPVVALEQGRQEFGAQAASVASRPIDVQP